MRTTTDRVQAAREGIRLARERGVRIGRPPHEQRKEMVRLKRAGKSFRTIARALGCSTATIARALEEAE